ncbi:MAG: hypothetical protein K9J16_08515 [Melioribacteraceae bacterium]|nr:hypothetical protein [Melioribacteraceae bacterium]MCF8353813.1 hypothetical protein [Melioribacteraceae bacterium]MCF8393649.1 hypothetical protein [Melioribacteraceae bacterium]MCF8419459.1 hypothetical protein [Melioribacteraceae bacterium]
MKNTFVLVLITLLTSCFSNVDPESQADYIELKNSFPDSLMKYFPKILPIEFNGYTYSSGYGHYQTSKFINVNTRFTFKHRYNIQKNKLLEFSSSKLLVNDSCVIKIFTDPLNEVFNITELIEKTNSLKGPCTSKYPIPDFLFEDSDYQITEIHLIDADTTFFLEKENKPTLEYLPPKW